MMIRVRSRGYFFQILDLSHFEIGQPNKLNILCIYNFVFSFKNLDIFVNDAVHNLFPSPVP